MNIENESIWDRIKPIEDFKKNHPEEFNKIKSDIESGEFIMKIAVKYKKKPKLIRLIKTYLSIKV